MEEQRKQDQPYDGPDRRDETIEVSGPGGLKAVLKNPNSSFLVLLLLSLFFYYISYKQEAAASERNMALMVRMDKMEHALIEAKVSTDLLIYVTSLSETERSRLNFRQPKGLSELQR